MGCQFLRIIGEDSAKDNTGEIQVYVPSDVASYLLNEKRQDIINIEKSNNIRVLVIADPYKARPYYKVVRIKASDIKNIDSYKLTPNSPEPNTDWRDDKNQSKGMKPLVDGIKPPKMPKKKKDGLVGWIKSIAGIDKEEKPKKKTTRSNNQNRNRKPRQNSKPKTNKGAASKNNNQRIIQIKNLILIKRQILTRRIILIKKIPKVKVLKVLIQKMQTRKMLQLKKVMKKIPNKIILK